MNGQPVVIGLRGPHPQALQLAMHDALVGRTFVKVVHRFDPDDPDEGRGIIETIRGQAVLSHFRTPPVGFELATAGVVDALERCARSARALVLGCGDSSWFTQLHPGDIVARLARHADSPVVVVPRSESAAAGRGRVVLAAGQVDSSPAATRFALEQAQDRGSELCLRLDDQVGVGDLIVLERPRDPSLPFAALLSPMLAAAVATAIDRGCAVSIVPPER